MGDRANACIRADQESPGVYFYVHWAGGNLPDLIREALGTPQARARWDDAPYLTRIIADHLSAQGAGPAGSETGMGISTEIQDDNQGSVLVLDVEQQIVFFGQLDRTEQGAHNRIAGPWTFEEYARRPEAPSWPREEDQEEGDRAAF